MVAAASAAAANSYSRAVEQPASQSAVLFHLHTLIQGSTSSSYFPFHIHGSDVTSLSASLHTHSCVLWLTHIKFYTSSYSMHTRRALIRRPQIYSSPELTPANNQGQQLHTHCMYIYILSLAPKLQFTRAHSPTALFICKIRSYGGAKERALIACAHIS
jgi:hypothetical protein